PRSCSLPSSEQEISGGVRLLLRGCGDVAPVRGRESEERPPAPGVFEGLVHVPDLGPLCYVTGLRDLVPGAESAELCPPVAPPGDGVAVGEEGVPVDLREEVELEE